MTFHRKSRAADPLGRSGAGLAMAALAVLVLAGGAMAQGRAKAAVPKGAAPPGAAAAAPKAAAPKAGPAPQAAEGPPQVSSILPEGQLLLVPGRQLKVRIVDGAPQVVSEGPAPRDHTTANNPNATVAQWLTLGSEDQAGQPGVVVFTLYYDPARGSKLVVGNGEAIGVLYAAELLLTRNGSSASLAVNTCSVPGSSAAVESWASTKVDAVLVPHIGETPLPQCFDPASNKFYPPGSPPSAQAAATPKQ